MQRTRAAQVAARSFAAGGAACIAAYLPSRRSPSGDTYSIPRDALALALAQLLRSLLPRLSKKANDTSKAMRKSY